MPNRPRRREKQPPDNPSTAMPGDDITITGFGLTRQSDIYVSRTATGPRILNPISATEDGTSAVIRLSSNVATGPVWIVGAPEDTAPILTVQE